MLSLSTPFWRAQWFDIRMNGAPPRCRRECAHRRSLSVSRTADVSETGRQSRVAGVLRPDRLVRSPKTHVLAMILAGLSQAVALSQSTLPQTESGPSGNPAVVGDWADRLLANDPKVRAAAEAALVQGARGSL